MTRQEFIDKFYPYAEMAANALNTDPLFILSQWILETGGQENPSHNLAGIGAFDNPLTRKTIYGEYFANYTEFTNAYIKTIKSNFPLAENTNNITEFAKGLQNGRYGSWATDKNYINKLINVYNSITGTNISTNTGGLSFMQFNLPDPLSIGQFLVYIVLIIIVIFIMLYSGRELLK